MHREVHNAQSSLGWSISAVVEAFLTLLKHSSLAVQLSSPLCNDFWWNTQSNLGCSELRFSITKKLVKLWNKNRRCNLTLQSETTKNTYFRMRQETLLHLCWGPVSVKSFASLYVLFNIQSHLTLFSLMGILWFVGFTSVDLTTRSIPFYPLYSMCFYIWRRWKQFNLQQKDVCIWLRWA